MATTAPFYSIIDYAVDGPRSRSELVAAFVDLQERWVRFYPGYCAARIFASHGGRRVYDVVQWASESDYRHFESTSDTRGRLAAIEAAVGGVSGWAEPRMVGAPWFTPVHEVPPGHAPSEPISDMRASDAT